MPYALLVGEMLIDFIPHTAQTNGERCYQPHPGGAMANVAVALARLGGTSRFIGKLSEDSFGRLLLNVLNENRVDTRFVPTTTQGPTTLALVTLQEDGQRSFTFYRQQTADTLLKPGDLSAAAWMDVALLHVGSVSLSVEPARSATLAALEQAQTRHVLVSCDVNARPALWSNAEELRMTLDKLGRRVDLLKFSAEEAHYLDPAQTTPLDPADTSALTALGTRLLAQGPALVVITRGELGALLITAHHISDIAATAYIVRDTTGAGDAFMGALLFQLLHHNWLTREKLAALSAPQLHALGSFANRAAGLSCTRYGGIASLPTLAEVAAEQP